MNTSVRWFDSYGCRARSHLSTSCHASSLFALWILMMLSMSFWFICCSFQRQPIQRAFFLLNRYEYINEFTFFHHGIPKHLWWWIFPGLSIFNCFRNRRFFTISRKRKWLVRSWFLVGWRHLYNIDLIKVFNNSNTAFKGFIKCSSFFSIGQPPHSVEFVRGHWFRLEAILAEIFCWCLSILSIYCIAIAIAMLVACLCLVSAISKFNCFKCKWMPFGVLLNRYFSPNQKHKKIIKFPC